MKLIVLVCLGRYLVDIFHKALKDGIIAKF